MISGRQYWKTKSKKTRLIMIGVAVLLLVIGMYLAFATSSGLGKKQGLQICPTEMIVNQMPSIDRSGESESEALPTRSSYYILNGERKEIDDFDISWVGENCRVPVTSVY